MKKLFASLLMMALVLTTTVCYAAGVTVSASKTSGEVKTDEQITYTAKTTAGIYVKSLDVKIVDSDTNVEISKTTSTPKETNVGEFIVKYAMPNIAHKNITVTVTANSTKGTDTQTYHYTMDMTQNVQVTTDKTGTISKGDMIQLTATASLKGYGVTLITYTWTDANGNVIRTNSMVPQDQGDVYKKVGVAKAIWTINGPVDCTTSTAKLNVKVQTKDTGDSKNWNFDFDYVISDGQTNSISILASEPDNSTLATGTAVKFSAKSSNVNVGIKNMVVIIKDANGNVWYQKSIDASNQTVGANPLNFIKTFNEPGKYYVGIQATDVLGNKKVTEFIYTIQGDKKPADDEEIVDPDDDDDEDDEDYEGVLNPEGEDLVVDLWLSKDTRFYEYGETFEMVAYYYNFDKKDKKNCVLEIEFPDEFKPVTVTPDRGTVSTKKNGYIKIKLGTVPSKKLGKVVFTVKSIDDDCVEDISDFEAIIYADTDDEEDRSLQRVWIYEEGETGTRTGFVKGYTDGSFRADNSITREEVAAMMARAFNHSANKVTKTFKDVKTTSWSYRYIAGCATAGIITGYTDGSFKPRNNITRGELYAMTYRAMGIDDAEDYQCLFVPKQYKKDTSWETNYIANLVRMQMTEDIKDLDADEEASRAEVVYFINRVQFREVSKFTVGTYNDLRKSHYAAKDIEAASHNYNYKRTSDGKEKISNIEEYVINDYLR